MQNKRVKIVDTAPTGFIKI
jgi:hypothetical protein